MQKDYLRGFKRKVSLIVALFVIVICSIFAV